MNVETDEYDIHCNSQKNKITRDDKNYPLCVKFLRNFDKVIFRLLLNADDKEEECKSLNYWLYDTANKNTLEGNENDITSSDIITKLHGIWKNFDINENCDIELYKIKKDDFDNMKTLYYYARDYKTIKNKIKDSGNNCSEVYHTYIEKGKEAYRDINIMCLRENPEDEVTAKICNEFNYIKGMNSDEDLSKLTCNKTEIIPIQEEEEEDPELVQHGLGESVSDGTSSSTAMGIIFPFLGITLILFMLYKFSPFGPWLRSYLIKKKLIRYNIDENETFQELPHEHDYANKNNENDMRIIGYHAG
ncbi:PIR Superfamily Protein [Plasmodium ovale wallikeri]|uniref:PIR Superfamily Protein n=1 Tax=Plasmodium ovale wallikeri TaxID=864142 RepID=A0A1A9AN34_PLAOA|nr:PIR Superfamily Protein [Plasmodium ovale wallikeri]SBT57631.1 PIR Superfamily Protein [Plasmodium ovale wallikeri]